MPVSFFPPYSMRRLLASSLYPCFTCIFDGVDDGLSRYLGGGWLTEFGVLVDIGVALHCIGWLACIGRRALTNEMRLCLLDLCIASLCQKALQ